MKTAGEEEVRDVEQLEGKQEAGGLLNMECKIIN